MLLDCHTIQEGDSHNKGGRKLETLASRALLTGALMTGYSM